MRIGELAERSGTSTRMLRHYERRGLLPARRAGNGYRDYDEHDLLLVREIRALQEVGLGLDDTGPFLDCLRSGHRHGDECPASLDVYRRKLDDLDQLIDRLDAARTRLRAQLAAATARATEPRCEFTSPSEPPGEHLCPTPPPS